MGNLKFYVKLLFLLFFIETSLVGQNCKGIIDSIIKSPENVRAFVIGESHHIYEYDLFCFDFLKILSNNNKQVTLFYELPYCCNFLLDSLYSTGNKKFLNQYSELVLNSGGYSLQKCYIEKILDFCIKSNLKGKQIKLYGIDGLRDKIIAGNCFNLIFPKNTTKYSKQDTLLYSIFDTLNSSKSLDSISNVVEKNKLEIIQQYSESKYIYLLDLLNSLTSKSSISNQNLREVFMFNKTRILINNSPNSVYLFHLGYSHAQKDTVNSFSIYHSSKSLVNRILNSTLNNREIKSIALVSKAINNKVNLNFNMFNIDKISNVDKDCNFIDLSLNCSLPINSSFDYLVLFKNVYSYHKKKGRQK